MVGSRLHLFAAVLACCVSAPSAGFAEIGVTEKSISIGMVNGITGPVAHLSSEYRRGVDLVFNEVNRSGGIHGRQLEIAARDDKYDPKASFDQTLDLLTHHEILCLLGAVGTATSNAVRPLLEKYQVPFLMPVSGGDFLRTPLNPFIFPGRASYEDEGEAIIHELVDKRHLTRIGIFTQHDAYGEAGKQAVYRALAKRKLKGSGEGVYERGTVDVQEALKQLKSANPQAVVLFSVPPSAVAFLKAAKVEGFAPVFAGTSPVNYAQLLNELGELTNGILFSDSIPLASSTNLPMVKNYLASLKKIGGGNPDPNSLEGYIAAQILVDALKRTGPDLTRLRLRDSLEQMDKSVLDGIAVSYNHHEHQGLSKVYMFIARDRHMENVPE